MRAAPSAIRTLGAPGLSSRGPSAAHTTSFESKRPAMTDDELRSMLGAINDRLTRIESKVRPVMRRERVRPGFYRVGPYCIHGMGSSWSIYRGETFILKTKTLYDATKWCGAHNG